MLRIGNSSVDFGFWMTLDDGDPELRCRARVTTVAVHMQGGKKRAIPSDVRDLLEAERIDLADFPGPR